MKKVIVTLGCMIWLGMGNQSYAALGDTGADLIYTPVTPCRIIDTREPGAGGPILGNATRDFVVTGTTGFETQGGHAGGCGIPEGATSVMINFIAVGPTASGHLRAWPYGGGMPNASIINFFAAVAGLNIANGLIQPICDSGMTTCSFDLSIYAASQVNVVADVTGYFGRFPTEELPPGVGVTPWNSPPNPLDGTASAGSSANYSRGDHKHGIAVGSITSSHIQDGTITNLDISASAAIDFSKLSGVAPVTHDHNAAYVNVTGDTMTGTLNLPSNGLVAGTNQFVLSGGNVGIGMPSPTQKLEVSGNVKISGAGNGLAFPDGTIQKTAVSGGGGVPPGFMILGSTSTAPSGYTYTGKRVDASWSARADMPTARGGVVGAVVNNKIYVIGGLAGSTPLETNEEYDPATNTWTTKASMDTARYAPAVGVVGGKIYVIGGTNSVPFSSALTTNEVYDPVLNTWTPKAGIPVATTGPAAAVVNGKIYVIGGGNGVANLVNNQEYDPAMNSWAAKAAIPSGARLAPGGAVVNNKIYVIGGVGGATFLGTNEEYNPATNNWAAKAAMPTAREVSGCALPVLNNRIYVMGGVNGANASIILPNNEEYNPATNTWTIKAGMPTARRTHATVAVNNKIYAIGGNDANLIPFPVFSTNEEYDPGSLYVHKKD